MKQAFNKATTLDPNNITSYYIYSRWLFTRCKFEAASVEFEKCINIGKQNSNEYITPLTPDIYYFYSLCLYRIKNFEKSDLMFNIAENIRNKLLKSNTEYSIPPSIKYWVERKREELLKSQLEQKQTFTKEEKQEETPILQGKPTLIQFQPNGYEANIIYQNIASRA